MLLFILPIIVVTVIVVAYLVLSPKEEPKTDEEKEEEQLKKEQEEKKKQAQEEQLKEEQEEKNKQEQEEQLKKEQKQEKLRQDEQKQQNQQLREFQKQKQEIFQEELAKTLDRENKKKDTQLDHTIKKIRNTVYNDDNLLLNNNNKSENFRKFTQEFKDLKINKDFDKVHSYVRDDILKDISRNDSESTKLIELHNYLKKIGKIYDVVLKLEFLQWLHNYKIAKLEEKDNYNNLKKSVIETIMNLNVTYDDLNNTSYVQKELERLRQYVFEIKGDFNSDKIEQHINTKIKKDAETIIRNNFNESLRNKKIHDEFYNKYDIEFTYDDENTNVFMNIIKKQSGGGSYSGYYITGGTEKVDVDLGNIIDIIIKNFNINEILHKINHIFESLKNEKPQTENQIIDGLFNNGFNDELTKSYETLNKIQHSTSSTSSFSISHCRTLLNFDKLSDKYDKLKYVFQHIELDNNGSYIFSKEQRFNYEKNMKALINFTTIDKDKSKQPIAMFDKINRNINKNESQQNTITQSNYDILKTLVNIFNKNDDINLIHMCIISLYKLWLIDKCDDYDEKNVDYNKIVEIVNDSMKKITCNNKVNTLIPKESKESQESKESKESHNNQVLTDLIKLFVTLLDVYFDVSRKYNDTFDNIKKYANEHIKYIVTSRFKKIYYKTNEYTIFKEPGILQTLTGQTQEINFELPKTHEFKKQNDKSIVFTDSSNKKFIKLDYSHDQFIIYDRHMNNNKDSGILKIKDELSSVLKDSDYNIHADKLSQTILKGKQNWRNKVKEAKQTEDEEKLYQTQRIRLTYYNSDIMKRVIQKLLFDKKGNTDDIIKYYENKGTSREFFYEKDTKIDEKDTKIDENNSYYIHEINVLKSLNIIKDENDI